MKVPAVSSGASRAGESGGHRDLGPGAGSAADDVVPECGVAEKSMDQGQPTLDDVDPPAWTWPPEADTFVVQRCHALRKVPLDSLRMDDLRMLVNQCIALPVLLPRALERAEADPLPGEYEHEALLRAMRRVPPEHLGALPDADDFLRRLARAEVRAAEARARLEAPWWTPEEIGLPSDHMP